MQITGIDVGGTGIKGAQVDTETGELLTKRQRMLTPQPATPAAVAEAVAEMVAACGSEGPVGVGFPAAMRDGVALTASNLHPSFVGVDVAALLTAACGRPVAVLNDADAAGLAEASFGAARGQAGTVLVITVGTGLGTALCVDGRLVPNTEFGHVLLHGDIAEAYASDSARKRDDLNWKTWAGRFDEYLQHLRSILYPSRFVIGGGAAKKFERFGPHLTVETPVVPATLGNQAGLVGAAMHAERELG
ncbi:MAG: ROK family protein [Planctomycetota bacterium]|nr:MAG: ROK family protein [Planctomycetota bacterium]